MKVQWEFKNSSSFWKFDWSGVWVIQSVLYLASLEFRGQRDQSQVCSKGCKVYQKLSLTFTCIPELSWLRVHYSLFISGIWAADNCRCLILAYFHIFFKSWLQLGELHPLMLLTLSWRRSLSYKNQSIDLQSKSVGWFLYDRDQRRSSVFFVNFEHTLHLFLVLLLLNLNR